MEYKYDNIVKDILITHDEIIEMAKRLGKQISEDYAGKEIHMICVLKGGVFFMTS